MGKFKGILRQGGVFSAKVGKNDLQKTAQLRDVTNQPVATITREKSPLARLLVTTPVFTAILEKTYIIYRFVSAKSLVKSIRKSSAFAAKAITSKVNKRTATANNTHAFSAPAVDLEIEKQIKADNSVRPEAATTAIAKPRKKIPFAVNVLLLACKRRACEHTRTSNIRTRRIMFTAKGLRTHRYGACNRNVTAIACDAPGICTEINRRSCGNRTIIAENAPTIDAAREVNASAKSEIIGYCAKTYRPEYQKGNSPTCYARMSTWIDPEVVDGVLYLRQAHSVTQIGSVLEVK